MPRRPLRRRLLKPLELSASSMTEEDKIILQRTQGILKHMNREDVNGIYDLIKSRVRNSGLKIDIEMEEVAKPELRMRTLFGKIEKVTAEEIDNLDRDVVKINSVRIEENGEVKTPRYSTYFYKSSGTSRGTDLMGIWLPCGEVPLLQELSSKVRYSKLEDKILEKVNTMLDGRASMNQDIYQGSLAEFMPEFPTWNELSQSILTFGRFISEINAMISYKLRDLYTADSDGEGAGEGAVASGLKDTKPKPKPREKKKGSRKKQSGKPKRKGSNKKGKKKPDSKSKSKNKK